MTDGRGSSSTRGNGSRPPEAMLVPGKSTPHPRLNRPPRPFRPPPGCRRASLCPLLGPPDGVRPAFSHPLGRPRGSPGPGLGPCMFRHGAASECALGGRCRADVLRVRGVSSLQRLPWLCLALRSPQNTLDGMQVLEGSGLPRAAVLGGAFPCAWCLHGSLGLLSIPGSRQPKLPPAAGCVGTPEGGGHCRWAPERKLCPGKARAGPGTWSPVSRHGHKGQAGRTAQNPDDYEGCCGVVAGGGDSFCPWASHMPSMQLSCLLVIGIQPWPWNAPPAVFVSAVCMAGAPPAGEGSSLPSRGQDTALLATPMGQEERCYPSGWGFECFAKLSLIV